MSFASMHNDYLDPEHGSRYEPQYETCQAKVQDEFPGWNVDGTLVQGGITQIEYDGEVMGWFFSEKLAEHVCEALNNCNK